MQIPADHYTPQHRLELETLLNSPAWQAAIDSGLVEEVKAERLEPGKARGFVPTVVDHLLMANKERAAALIAEGCSDRDRLLSLLADWPNALRHADPTISFVGLNLTSACDLDPRCLYCNQPEIESTVGVARWKSIIEEVASGAGEEGPYLYLTGGEPLTLGADLWGDDGIVRFATARRARVNVNTNAVNLTPEVALRLIKGGLARLHISLDAAEEATHNHLAGGNHFRRVLEGIYNLQLARDLVGVSYPGVHINCVLTNANLDLFPPLFAFLLERHKQTADNADPFYQDLFPHIIPVGGVSNAHLRPSAADFRRFYEQVWPQVGEIWDNFQASLGVSAEERKALFGPFTNPFLRVEHKGGLDAYVEVSAQGRYGALALARRCYVAPTQALFTPDGCQYRCGSHAIRRLLPIGNVADHSVLENMRAGIPGLAELPQEEHCYGCALATLYINQTIESKLTEELNSMLEAKG